jgi:CHAT domain-containing protein
MFAVGLLTMALPMLADAADSEVSKQQIARQLMTESGSLRAEWSEKALRHAAQNYDAAKNIFLATGDYREAAAALIRSGETFFVLAEYREALKRYEDALVDARRAHAHLEQAEAFSQRGRLYSYLGNNDKAEASVKIALGLLPSDISDADHVTRRIYGEILSNLGEIDYAKGNLVKSSADFEIALKLFDELDERQDQARVHLFKGYIAGSIGDSDNAIAEITRARSLYDQVSDKSGEGLCLTALGLSHSQQRDEALAIELHRQAREIFRTIGNRQSEAITINALGQTYEFLNEYAVALDNYREALHLFQEIGAVDLTAVTTFKIARAYRLLGDSTQALSYYEQSLRLSKAAGDHRVTAMALSDIAVIYAAEGNQEKTIRQFRKIIRFYAANKDRRGQANTLNNLGDFFFAKGDKREALNVYTSALDLSEQIGDEAAHMSCLYNVARTQRDLGALPAALSYIERSIAMAEQLRSNVASPDYRASYFSGVRKQYELLIDILMQLERQQTNKSFAAKALLASENSRARSLIDLITESGVDIRQDAKPELLAKERELQGLTRAQAEYQMELAMKGSRAPESAEVTLKINELKSEYQQIEAQLRDQTLRFKILGEAAPPSIEEIQSQLLDDNSMVLEYALGDERSYLWAITRSSFKSYELPPRRTVEDSARDVYELITSRQTIAGDASAKTASDVAAADRLYPEKASLLSRTLLGPVADQLGTMRLIVVTEGILQYIPFDALPTPKSNYASQIDPREADELPLLVNTNEVITLPSLATLAAIRREKHIVGAANKIVAVLADPVFSASDDRVHPDNTLPKVAATAVQRSPQSNRREVQAFDGNLGPVRLLHASEEADAIISAAPTGMAMVAKGFDASRETATSPLVAQYKIVHFATHGFLNNEHPELSGIVLTMTNRDGSKANGFMPVRDIYKLNLSADLVVLSACETALGKDVRGEGLFGLTRGFMASGSRSVVASLWKVDDRSTAVLMAHFYKAMLQDGLTPAAALRSAKESVRNENGWRAPYFWAGFVLQGEYNDRIVANAANATSGFHRGIVIICASAFFCLAVMIWQRVRRRSVEP